MTIDTVERGALAGLTREQLLAMCKERGLAATAWKRGRMEAVLTGEEPAPEPRPKKETGGNALAAQMEARSRASEGDEAVRKAAENREKRQGRCESTVCSKGCQGYEEGRRDPFGWQLCTCGHTQWAHAETA